MGILLPDLLLVSPLFALGGRHSSFKVNGFLRAASAQSSHARSTSSEVDIHLGVGWEAFVVRGAVSMTPLPTVQMLSTSVKWGFYPQSVDA